MMMQYLNSNLLLKNTYNNLKFYSTSSAGSDINNSFNNNEFTGWLPSLSCRLNDDSNRFYKLIGKTKPSFVDELTNTLKDLNKEIFTYKLEFFLFLHTNNGKIKSKFYLFPGMTKKDCIAEIDQLNMNVMGLTTIDNELFYEIFLYHGFSRLKSDLIDLELVNNEQYSKNIFVSLSKTVDSSNSNIRLGFIELNKDILLKITRKTKKNTSSGVNSSNFESSNKFNMLGE